MVFPWYSHGFPMVFPGFPIERSPISTVGAMAEIAATLRLSPLSGLSRPRPEGFCPQVPEAVQVRQRSALGGSL